jgi:hypothetical protein
MSIQRFIFGLAALRKALPESKTALEKEFELDENDDDFASHFYDEVNNVIGGTNPNEKLTLLLPGIALTKSDFEYDYKNNAAKGPVIEANESRLANKLYDPFDMVGGDNGKTLEHQYRSALDMLTPKLNPIIANAKNQLRELLMKPFPYKFGPKNIMRAEILKSREKSDKTTEYYFENAPADKVEADANSEEELKTYTFQEVFFRLYNDYVEQLGEWANERQRRKDYYVKCAKANLELTTESQKNKQSENDYLQWYEDNGESWLTAVNQKLSVLLSVFSATDMKIVEGILDSGSGAELQEARQTLNNTRKINPDGGYIYPVKFNPTNWFEYLDTSFTPVDLVNSPTAILDELKLLYTRRDYINSRITDISAQIPSTTDLDNAKKAVESARSEYNRCDDALQDAMDTAFGDFAKFLTVAICDACCPQAGADALTQNKAAIENNKKTATDVLAGANVDTQSIKEKVTKVVTLAADNKQEEATTKVETSLDKIKKAVTDANLQKLVTNATDALNTLKTAKKDTKKNSIETEANNFETAITALKDGINFDQLIKAKDDIINSNKSEKEKNEAKEAKENLEEAKDAATEIINVKDEVKKDATKTLNKEAAEKDDLKEAAKNLNIAGTITKGIDIIFEGGTKVNMAQSAYLTSISSYTEALLNEASKKNLTNLHLQISNLKMDKNTVDSKIKVLQEKLSRVNDFEECFSDSVNPPSVPDGFTQFNIVHTVSSTSSQSKSEEKTTVSSTTAGFWIFKSKKRSVHTESHIENLCKTKGTEIQIGMNVAKVGIEREWFNPGVFALTGEMYNVADKTEQAIKDEKAELTAHGITGKEPEKILRISHGADLDNQEHMLNLSHDVFPCYPTAMVIARDVTIKLTTASNSDYSKLDETTDEVSKSKAFFVYNAGDGSRTHTSNGKCKTKSNSRAITIRFTTPQVIGFYQQIVPKDVSTAYPKDKAVNEENSIVKFIEAYEDVIKRRLDAENAV